jgi:large subunit ribosomal protein L18
MSKIELNKKRRMRRKKSIRLKINGNSSKPRLSVYKSNKYIYVQAIDDNAGITIVSSSSIKYEGKDKKLNKTTAIKVGEEIAKKLKEKNIDEVIFDRNGFLYTGKIKALADSARKNGLKF